MFLIAIVLSMTAPTKINSTDPRRFNDFPNYIWVYIHHLVTAQLGEMLSLIVFVKKYENLQKNIQDNISEKYEMIRHLFTSS